MDTNPMIKFLKRFPKLLQWIDLSLADAIVGEQPGDFRSIDEARAAGFKRIYIRPKGLREIGKCDNCGGPVYLGIKHIHRQNTYEELKRED